VTDFTLSPDAIAGLSRDAVTTVSVACQHLGLSQRDPESIPWSSRRADGLLPDLGQQLQSLLAEALVDGIPDLAFVPADSATPHHRLWVAADCEPVIPWELTVSLDGTHLGLDPRMGLVYRDRWSDVLPPERARSSPLKVVVASCMPARIPSANIDTQRLALAEAFGSFAPSWLADHEWLSNPSLDRVRQAVSPDTTLLHVVAHGRPGEILWQDGGEPKWLSADAFCRGLSGIDLPLVSFCVCDSAHSRHASSPPLAVMACRTFAQAAIGMRGLLSDTAGASYLRGLLMPLATASPSVDRMATEARCQILRADETADWARPTLFVRDGMVRLHVGPRQAYDPTPQHDRPTRFLTVGATQVDASGVLLLGRSAKADVVIPGPKVAAFAAVVDGSGEAAEVRDQTGDGICLNGLRVSRALLTDGDQIRVGELTMPYSERSSGGV
jgi:FHA domain